MSASGTFVFADRGQETHLSDPADRLLLKFSAEARMLIGQATAHARQFRGREPQIDLALYESEELSPVSRKIGDRYAIGMPTGIGRRLRELFGALVGTGLPIAYLNTAPGLETSAPLRISRDHKAEGEFADILAIVAMRYAFNHELMHVVHGHLDHIAAVEVSGKRLDNWERQVLEFDADAGATSRSLTGLTGYVGASKSPPALAARNVLFNWGLAVYVLFRHQAVEGPIFEDLDARRYPAPQLRAVGAHVTLISQLFARKEGASSIPFTPEAKILLDADPPRILNHAVRISEHAFSKLQAEPFSTSLAEQGLHEEAVTLYKERYNQVWRSLQPKLLQYAWCSLVPADRGGMADLVPLAQSVG